MSEAVSWGLWVSDWLFVKTFCRQIELWSQTNGSRSFHPAYLHRKLYLSPTDVKRGSIERILEDGIKTRKGGLNPLMRKISTSSNSQNISIELSLTQNFRALFTRKTDGYNLEK